MGCRFDCESTTNFRQLILLGAVGPPSSGITEYSAGDRGAIHQPRRARLDWRTPPHYRPKREKENFKRRTLPSRRRLLPPFHAATNESGAPAERQSSAASAPEGVRLRAFTTKSHTTGLVSGCVPSTPHHVPHASTSPHLRLRS